jgi:hypothetical protein
MTNQKSVVIKCKEHFQTKNAINRFKRDLKKCEPKKINSLEDGNYLKIGFFFDIISEKNQYIVNIITLEEHMRIEQKKVLRKRLHNAKHNRSSIVKQERESLKRSIPKKMFKSYQNLMKNNMFANNIPNPTDIINNPEKYKNQISQIMGTQGPLSDNPKAHNALRNYFDTMGNFMGIEPTQFKTTQEINPIQPVQLQPSQLEEVETDDEDNE